MEAIRQYAALSQHYPWGTSHRGLDFHVALISPFLTDRNTSTSEREALSSQHETIPKPELLPAWHYSEVMRVQEYG